MTKDTFYLASTGRAVTNGDVIRGMYNKDGIRSTTIITLNDTIIPMLVQAGVLLKEPPKKTPSISEIIMRLSTKLGWKPEKVERYLNGIVDIMPMAAFNIVSRELAIMLDEKYPDHINDSEEIYCISSLDGRIHKLCKAYIKNYRNFAAFRTIEDAKLACHILREPLKEMFSGKK